MQSWVIDFQLHKDAGEKPEGLFFKKNKFIYLFIFGCVGSSLLRVGFL